MPTESKKLTEVNVAVMEAENGDKYLHATGDGVFEYIVLWNEQMLQARQEERDKISALVHKIAEESGYAGYGFVDEILDEITKLGEVDGAKG